MILIDYSAVSYGNFVSQKAPPEKDILRHMILNTLRSYNLKFRAKYGEMVLCCDHATWRKDVFPEYKFKRKADREDSDTDWDAVFTIFNEIMDEIKTFMPWKVVHVRGAEGDDVIATLTKRTQEFGQHEPAMIIASDGDYKQLQVYDNVKQWSPMTKKLVDEPNPRRWLFENTVKGQGKDGIPNILSDDDFYVKKVKGDRQSSISAKKLNAWWDSRDDLESVLSTKEKRNFDRNAMLMDFNKIPDKVADAINEAYEAYEPAPFSGVLNYLIKNRCRVLIDAIGDFEPKSIK